MKINKRYYEIKDIMKIIKSLGNTGVSLKGTTRKITSHEGGFLNFLRPLMAAGLPLMKNLLTPLAKSLFFPLWLSADKSAADATVQKKIYGSEKTALIISKKGIKDLMKIVNLLEECALLIKGVSKTIKNEANEEKGGFLGILLGNLGASSLGWALKRRGVIWAGEGTIRVGQDF